MSPLPHPSRDRSGRRGVFTLLELLVVIGVLAVLVALLLPGLGRARDAALEVQCRGQLLQVGAGLEMYRGDHGDWFPFGWWQGSVTEPVGHARYPTWDWLLLPYLGMDRRLFRCPADPLLFERTYSYNAASNERLWGPWRLDPPWCLDACSPPCWRQDAADAPRRAYGLDTFTAAAVERPAQTVSVRELNPNWVHAYAVSAGGAAPWKLGQLGHWWHSIHHYVATPAEHHRGCAAYLMVDGHVEPRPAAEMPGNDWARTGWWYARRKF
jgi:hypothetical protein